MIIKFSDDATTATMGEICAGLIGWTLEVKYTRRLTMLYGEPVEYANGFPRLCSIASTSSEDVVLCDVNDEGAPLLNSLYHVGYDEIDSITVV